MQLAYIHDRDRWTAQVEENTARLAFAWGSFNSIGTSELDYADPVDFGLTFAHEPTVSYGFAVNNADELDELPRVTGGVYKWRQDGHGFYIGAHVYVVVDLLSGTVPDDINVMQPDVSHSFFFAGIALKDIGADAFRD